MTKNATNLEWMRKVGVSAEECTQNLNRLIKIMRGQVMPNVMPKVTIKSVNYEKCEVKIENDGFVVDLTFIRKEIPTICKQIFKAVESITDPEDIAPGLSAITAYASKEVYANLTKEYLVAPGKKLLTMFENNGLKIVTA